MKLTLGLMGIGCVLAGAFFAIAGPPAAVAGPTGEHKLPVGFLLHGPTFRCEFVDGSVVTGIFTGERLSVRTPYGPVELNPAMLRKMEQVAPGLEAYLIYGMVDGERTVFVDGVPESLAKTLQRVTRVANTINSVASRHTTAPWLYPVEGKGEFPRLLIEDGKIYYPIRGAWARRLASGWHCYDENNSLIDKNVKEALPHYESKVDYYVVPGGALLAAPTGRARNATLVLTMDLRDGSRVRGKTKSDAFEVSCPYGKLSVPLADIRGITVEQLAAKGETWQQVKLEMCNGDRLTGSPRTTKVDVETAYGKLSVPLADVTKIEVSAGTGGCEPSVTTLSGPTYYAVAANPHSLAVVDLNHDGIPDVVSTETPNSGTHLSVLYGRGKGVLGGRADFVCGNRPQGLAAGDFDRDGHVDIAVVRQWGACVTIMKGQADGTLVAGANLPTKDAEPGYPRARDLNGDGRLDLVVCNYRSSSVSVFYGQPDGMLGNRKDFDTAPNPGSISFADFDHDGKIDMAVANQDGENNGIITILHGRGDGTFDRRQDVPMPGWRICGVVAADFNGDGRIDLATGEQSDGRIRVRYGAADGSFGPVVYFGTSGKASRVDETSAADFNGDGRIDLVAANTGTHTIDILFGRPDGSFGDRKTYTICDGPGQVIACDLNGDGRPDLVAATYGDTGQLAVFLGVPGRPKAAKPCVETTGLVLRYAFDKDEGAKITDRSSKGNHGTVHGAAWTAKGKIGGAYEFDGKDDYIELGPSNLYKSKGQLSACAWVFIRGQGAIVLSNYHGGSAYCGQFFFGLGSSLADGTFQPGMDVLFGQGPDAYVRYISKARPIQANEWHHVAFSYDEGCGNGNKIKLYLDGREMGGYTIQSEGNSGPVMDIAENLRIMAHRDTPTGTLSDGFIDEVMIFNRALSAEEIRQIYQRK